MNNRPRRSSHETYVGENPPTTSQLFRLATQAMASGRNFNKLRTLQRTPRAHFSIFESKYVNDISNMTLEIAPTEIQHRIAVRMGRKVLDNTPMKEWSLRIYDTRFYKTPTVDWSGVRNMYGFEWNRDNILMAKRQSYFVPAPEEPDMDFYIDHMSYVEKMANFMGPELEMAEVTADDCELLIADVTDYYAMQTLAIEQPAA